MSDPTPEQRADYMIRKLEGFIREGRKVNGMSFKTWQTMARAELLNAFLDLERRVEKGRQDNVVRRLILAGASGLVTIAFWGAATIVDRHWGGLATEIFIGAGLLLAVVAVELFLRHLANRYRKIARNRHFEQIVEFDALVKRLETELWLKAKKAREAAEKAQAQG